MLKITSLRLVAAIFLLQSVIDVLRREFRNSNVSAFRAFGQNHPNMVSNGQKGKVGLSQRKEKASDILIFFSSFAFGQKDNLKKYRSEEFPSIAVQKGNCKKKSRTKRNIFRGFEFGSSGLPGGNQSAINGTSSSGLVNDSMKWSSEAPTITTGTTTMATPSGRDPIRDINVTCDIDLLSCKNRCTKERDLGQTNDLNFSCYCDKYCETFIDCCYDYNQRCKNNSVSGHPSKLPLVGNMKSNIESNSDRYFKCISLPNGNNLDGTNGIWMIADCPNHLRNTTARRHCIAYYSLSYRNYKNEIPVITKDGKTYKNRFCSLCHGVSDDQLSYYALKFLCNVLPPKIYNKENTRKFLTSFCSISWKPNSGDQRRYCYSDIITKCSRAAPRNLRKGCHNGLPGIVFSQKRRTKFKNVYCALCHSATPTVCSRTVREGVSGCDTCGPPISFSATMTMDFVSSHQAGFRVVHRHINVCAIGKVYDPYLELCRTGIGSLPKHTGTDKYSISVWIINASEVWENTATTSRKNMLLLHGFIASFDTSNVLVSNTEVTTMHKTYRVLFDVEIKQIDETKDRHKDKASLTVADLIEFTQPIDVLIHSNNFTIIKVTKRRLTCIFVEKFLPHEYTIISNPESAAYINRTKEVIKQKDYYLSESKNRNIVSITVCRKRLSLPCINGTFINLSAYEVTEFPNKSVLWNIRGKIFTEGNYEKQNGTTWVCTNFSSNVTKETLLVEQTVEQSLSIATTVGLSLYVCSLSALLITYSIFCELCTLPGISLMNLSLSVLASHLLWLVGSGLRSETKLCTFISVVLHFVFLSSFVWMSIIAIDTWRAFTKTGQRTNRMAQRQKRKRYLPFMTIGWVGPLMFCLFCFTLDKTNTVAIGYGGTKGCWIQSTSSILYFFAVPMGVLLLLNAVFFVLTVKSINETMKNSQMARGQKRSKKDLAIFVRFAALMGFTWVFGFLSSVHLFLSYVFVISCTLQGVYIAVAFLFTKRILKLYSILLCKGWSSPSTKVSSLSHQKGQTEQPLRNCSSLNITNTKKNNLEHKTEFQTEGFNTDDTRL